MTAPAKTQRPTGQKHAARRKKQPARLVTVHLTYRDAVMAALGLLAAWGFGLTTTSAQLLLIVVLIVTAVIVFLIANRPAPAKPAPATRKPRTAPKEPAA